MSALPLVLDGSAFTALVVGGGAVAARKIRTLLEGGARVIVVAPDIAAEIRDRSRPAGSLSLLERKFAPADIEAGMIVVAATNDASLNRRIAAEAKAKGCLVNVVDDPDAGNFVTPAVHRSGDLAIAVSAGRAPAAAAAIRATLAGRFDERYSRAIASLRDMRETFLGAGRRDDWKRASAELISDRFCDDVEQGTIDERISSWR